MAILDADDSGHRRSASAWKRLISSDDVLVTTNYVVLEVFALAQRRLGMKAVRALEASVMPLVSVVWIDLSVRRSNPGIR